MTQFFPKSKTQNKNKINSTKMAMNLKKMEEQEKKDFNQTKKIMNSIFSKYEAKIEMEQTPTYYNIDAKMKATSKNNNSKMYLIEIKESNYRKPIEYCPMKVKKYKNVMNCVLNGETPLAVYLVNPRNEYYIFDLSKVDMDKVLVKNWMIAKVQYDEDVQEYKETLTYFFPVSEAIYKGEMVN